MSGDEHNWRCCGLNTLDVSCFRCICGGLDCITIVRRRRRRIGLGFLVLDMRIAGARDRCTLLTLVPTTSTLERTRRCCSGAGRHDGGKKSKERN